MSVSLPTVYVLVPAVATVVAALLAVVAWHRRPASGAAAFTLVLLSVAAWSFAYTMELLSTDAAGTLLWSRLSYLGIVVLPAAWLLFSLTYTGAAARVSRRLVAALAVVPLAVLAAVWTYPATGLVWAETTPVPFGDILVVRYTYGPLFWGNAVYSYGLLLAGTGILLRRFRAASRRNRRRIAVIVVGVVLPLAANALSNVGLRPDPPLNLTHLGFAVSGVLFFWSFFAGQLLDPRRAAREQVFEAAEQGVLLLNHANEVVDMNTAASAFLGVAAADAVGRPLDELLPRGESVFADVEDRIYNDEVVLPGEDGDRRLAVDVSLLYNEGQRRVMGRLVYLGEE